MIATIITAFIFFVSTNIDDIFILMILFSQRSNQMKKQHIIIGQYVGIGSLIVISIIGALGFSVIPQEYVGILGLMPIYLGIKVYLGHKKEPEENRNKIYKDSQKKDGHEFEGLLDTKRDHIITFIKSFINPNVLKVISITIANGADNIGIYIPLFTSMDLFNTFLTVIVFMILTALWCFIALRLSEQPLVQRNIKKYDYIFVPIIFIGLGIFILIKSGTINLFIDKIINTLYI
ncbi:cadmium resistance transporter [Clostridium sp.]|uniref:cadmium resistance transporter n=1 Tax=Clostridium sp. TaxID=1506 RepID=UPI0034646460